MREWAHAEMRALNFSVLAAALVILSADGAAAQAVGHGEAGTQGYSEEDEALYRKRFEALTDRTGASGLAAYDPLKDVPGAAAPAPLEMAKTPGISAGALETAGEYARAMNSTAMLIWLDGKLEAESYFGDVTAGSLLMSRSLAKPLSVIAVGRAMQEGHIESLDEPAANYFHEWRDTPISAITIRHLLGMRSGLKPQAPAPGIGDILNRAYLHPRHDEVIINDYPLTDKPGSRYEYSNANSELVAPLVERATGVEYEDWVSQEVLAPIGAAGGQVWMNREGGTAHAGCCWLLPAESWLRMAILLINDGEMHGRRLLPEGYVRAMTTAAAQNPHAGLEVYVAGDYIERRGAANPDRDVGETLHGEPYLVHDLFLFDGNSNQVIYIVPSARLAAARLGNRPPADTEWDNAYLINTLLRGLDDDIRAGLRPQPLPEPD
ncbi:MAG: serine hydrolase [Gammaproteobacteria bacterium]|nr:serine hydrolase [Gammaproteobacteria bacterium]MYD02911.1 serine hydrolase [Gammaproteobacteria bacterium]MYI24488.1 serine hydrolase [Gammaproteobacteria bacterium]